MSSSAALSVAAHAVLIGASVMATARGVQLAGDLATFRPVKYLIPEDRTPGRPGQAETLHFVQFGTSSFVYRPPDAAEEKVVKESAPAVDHGADSVTLRPVDPLPGSDSALSVLDVDTAVTRYINSAAPAFPPDLLARSIEGTVSTQYVVDTTGFADPASLKILRATHPQFALAVREALPFMRFYPAKVGNHKVRQLVEQDFTFRIRKAQPDSGRGGRGSG